MGLESWSLRDQPQSSDWLPLPYSKNHLQPAVRVSSDSFFSTSQVFAPWNKNTMPGVRNQCLEWECICGDYEQLPLSSIRRLCYLFARNFSHMWISLKKSPSWYRLLAYNRKMTLPKGFAWTEPIGSCQTWILKQLLPIPVCFLISLSVYVHPYRIYNLTHMLLRFTM